MTDDDVVERAGSLGGESGDEEGDNSGDESASVASTASNDDSASSTGAKKKKKRKSKKKRCDSVSDASAPDEASSSKPSINKAETDKRFNAALEGLRKGEDWIDLASCCIQPGKAKKLFEALKSNGSLTILNLSDNQINDEGAQAIAVVLGMRGASGLLDLDLRDNAFTEVGLETLEGLKKVRKDVTIRTGSMHEPAPAAEAAGGSSPKGSDGVKDVAKGKMFRKFFQTGDDDDEALSLQESQLDDRGINPQELWTEIREAASGCGDEGIPALAAKLQQLCLLLSRETMAIQSPKSNALDGSKPHIKECVANLDVLRTCLDIVPRNVTAQYNGSPQPAVGTHRVGAAEAVMLLLGPNNGSLDSAVSKSKLASKVVHIAVSHPLCSNLHVRALKLFRSCLISPVAELGLALMQPGWGCDLKDPLVTPESPCRPIPELLSAMMTPVVGVPSGLRSPGVGFLLEVVRCLHDIKSPAEADADEAKPNEAVVKALLMHAQVNSAWSEFSADGGPMHALFDEQGGDLCGPRPVRPLMEEGQDLAELAGGGLMSGREILALLQGMSAMGVMGNS